MALPTAPPDDPFSAAYREWTWELYRRISGRAAYDTAHEASPFDLRAALERPFPYQSGSLALVGRDLVGPRPPARLPGRRGAGAPPRRRVRPGVGQPDRATWWRPGSTSPRSSWTRTSAASIGRTLRTGPGRLDVVQGDMLAFSRGEPFDAAVFFESFHHCADHLAMLRRLHGIVRPERGGALRRRARAAARTTRGGRGSTGSRSGPAGPTAGSSWASTARYFDQALARTGWAGRRFRLGAAMGEDDVIVARPAGPSTRRERTWSLGSRRPAEGPIELLPALPPEETSEPGGRRGPLVIRGVGDAGRAFLVAPGVQPPPRRSGNSAPGRS